MSKCAVKPQKRKSGALLLVCFHTCNKHRSYNPGEWPMRSGDPGGVGVCRLLTKCAGPGKVPGKAFE